MHPEAPHAPAGTTADDRSTGAAERTVRETLAQLLDVDEDVLGRDAPLAAVDGWDSVNALRLLVHLERAAGTPLDFERFSAAQTVGDLATVLADAGPVDGEDGA